LSVSCLFAQGPIGPPIPARFLFPPELATYLQLTREQTDRISQLNLDYTRLSDERQQRVAQVRREIVQWTQAEPLDPGQLGIRYAEIEAIRRELRDAEAKMRVASLAVLNDVQKARLKVLDDAQRLQPLISEADCVGLLESAAILVDVFAVLPNSRIRGCTILTGFVPVPQP
jgi:hypothetical protein